MPFAQRASGSTSTSRRRARALGRYAAAHIGAAARARRDAPPRAAPLRRCCRSSRPTRARTAVSSATATSRLARIVEAADATPDELELREVNSSIYVFAAEKLWPAVERLDPRNAQGELYLTDAIATLVGEGEPVAIHVAPDADRR